VLLGGAFGAACAIFSIEFFDTTATQLAYIAACAIFGGITSVVVSSGIPLGTARKLPGRSRLKNLRIARLARLETARAAHSMGAQSAERQSAALVEYFSGNGYPAETEQDRPNRLEQPASS
jgi:hypothetical protein